MRYLVLEQATQLSEHKTSCTCLEGKTLQISDLTISGGTTFDKSIGNKFLFNKTSLT